MSDTSDLPQIEGVAFRATVDPPGYVVGDDGSVWSNMTRNGTRPPGWYQVNVYPPDKWNRYYRVALRREYGKGKVVVRPIHRLVLEAFGGPCPDGMECCHNDGDPTNNQAGNLRWDTTANNVADKKRHGTFMHGEGHPTAKLTEAKVVEIRRRGAAGESVKGIAAAMGVADATTAAVLRGESWAHVRVDTSDVDGFAPGPWSVKENNAAGALPRYLCTLPGFWGSGRGF